MSVPSAPNSGSPSQTSSSASTSTFCKICGCADIPDLDKRETATVLSIAHLTDWSAERIANSVYKYFSKNVMAEKVWDTYKVWEDARNESALHGPVWEEDLKTTRAMVGILKQHGIKPNFLARPLSQTPRPISVSFPGLCYPGIDDSVMLENFSEETRRKCLGALRWRAEEEHLAKPAPEEWPIMEKLGDHVAAIITKLLLHWTRSQIEVNKALPFTKAIEPSLDNMERIEAYAKLFIHEWEAKFGLMDITDELWLPLHMEAPLYRNVSTGDATKKFFYLMLVTRLQAMEERRLVWRGMIGFIEVPLEELPEDVRDCHICKHPLGVPDDDGETEMPLQLVACCGNYFGANCIRKWYGEFENPKCPLCKWTATESFVNKLRYESMEDEFDVDDVLDGESAMARMGSPWSPPPGFSENVEGSHGLGHNEISYDDETDLEDGEIREQ